MPGIHSSAASTTRYQVYCPQGLTEEFEAYVLRHGLSFAEALRRAIRLLLKYGDAEHAETALGDLEQRIVATLSQHGQRQQAEREEILHLLRELVGRDQTRGH